MPSARALTISCTGHTGTGDDGVSALDVWLRMDGRSRFVQVNHASATGVEFVDDIGGGQPHSSGAAKLKVGNAAATFERTSESSVRNAAPAFSASATYTAS